MNGFAAFLTYGFMVAAPSMLIRHVWRNRQYFNMSMTLIASSITGGVVVAGALLYFGVV